MISQYKEDLKKPTDFVQRTENLNASTNTDITRKCITTFKILRENDFNLYKRSKKKRFSDTQVLKILLLRTLYWEVIANQNEGLNEERRCGTYKRRKSSTKEGNHQGDR